MPCSYYTPEEEARMSAARARKELDRLTAELDKTREALIASMEGKEVPEDVAAKIHADQVKHRKEDLARLAGKLNWMRERVRKADPNKPLEPQLGFDPDSI